MRIEDFAPAIPNGKTLELMQRFNDAFGELAEDIIGAVEPSAHRTDALRKLLESKMTLIHGITHPRE
jgi:hypothetical protein